MIRPLHIVHGGIDNGDKRTLERVGLRGGNVSKWIVPKSAAVGDDVIVYVGTSLFATARIAGRPIKRRDWRNRYGAPLASVRLIQPPISLEVLRREIPRFEWATYPRSITTVRPDVNQALRALVKRRRKSRGADVISRTPVSEWSLDELYRFAIIASGGNKETRRLVTVRQRSDVVRRYVLGRANGICEACRKPAPFKGENGTPYLEAHHVTRLADEGMDHPRNGMGVCPNCHRKAHRAVDRMAFMRRLKKRVGVIERLAGH